jgi:4-alpha-glucanotransferase
MHLKSPAMPTVLPLQDWLAMDGELRRENPHDERINVPANSRHYWRYRMHITLEELLKADNINKLIRHKIAESGR